MGTALIDRLRGRPASRKRIVLSEAEIDDQVARLNGGAVSPPLRRTPPQGPGGITSEVFLGSLLDGALNSVTCGKVSPKDR